MKISFRRDIFANYMVIENTEKFSPGDFAVKMLEYNKINGLLKFGYENINGKTNLLYDISSRQAMVSVLENEKISCGMLFNFTASIKALVGTLEEYLLDENNIMLKKECIFLDLKSQEFSYCYNPYYNGDLRMELGVLFDGFLSEVDYEDTGAVKLAYDLNREVHSENFTVDSLASLCLKEPETDFGEEPSKMAQAENESEDCLEKPGMDINQEALFNLQKNQESPGFFKKLSCYLKGKSIYEIVEDIDSGSIGTKIKQSRPILLSSDLSDAGPENENNSIAMNLYKEDKKSSPEEEPNQLVFEEISLDVQNHKEDKGNETCLLNEEISVGRCLVGINRQRGQIMEINTYPFTIGKLKEYVNASSSSPAVSRMHCRIHAGTIEENTYYFEDLNSKNGSFINEKRVNPYKKMPLKPGDIIRIADEEYAFR